jgi:hypothetical protein
MFQMHIIGGAALQMEGDGTTLKAHAVFGDDSGGVHARIHQALNLTQARVLVPFSILTQRESDLTLPPTLDCRNLDIHVAGENILGVYWPGSSLRREAVTAIAVFSFFLYD